MEECEEEERREGRGGTITLPPHTPTLRNSPWDPPVTKECESPRRGGQNHDFRSYAYDAVPISRDSIFSQKVLFSLWKTQVLGKSVGVRTPRKVQMDTLFHMKKCVFSTSAPSQNQENRILTH